MSTMQEARLARTIEAAAQIVEAGELTAEDTAAAIRALGGSEMPDPIVDVNLGDRPQRVSDFSKIYKRLDDRARKAEAEYEALRSGPDGPDINGVRMAAQIISDYFRKQTGKAPALVVRCRDFDIRDLDADIDVDIISLYEIKAHTAGELFTKHTGLALELLVTP